MPDRKPKPARTKSAAEARVATLRLVWGALIAGGRTGRIPPAMLRAVLPVAADRRALRDTLRAVAAGAPIAYRGALALPDEGSRDWFDVLTVAADLARTRTERRAFEYARAHAARGLGFTK